MNVALLTLVLQIITLITQSQGVPQSFRDDFAACTQKALAAASITVTPEISTTTPTFGSITPTQGVIIPSVNKAIKIIVGLAGEDKKVVSYEVRAIYTENDLPKDGQIVTLTGNGSFTNISPADLADGNTLADQNIGGLFNGSVKIKTHKMAGEEGIVYAVFTPAGKNITITAEANGVTQTAVGHDQN